MADESGGDRMAVDDGRNSNTLPRIPKRHALFLLAGTNSSSSGQPAAGTVVGRSLEKRPSRSGSKAQNRRDLVLFGHMLGFQPEHLPVVQHRLQRRRIQQVLAWTAGFDLIRLFIPSSDKLCPL